MNAAQPPPDILEALRRYLDVQAEEKRLKEEKQALQDKLAAHMKAAGEQYWYPEVNGQALKVRSTEQTDIEYNEELLQERLGDRYLRILAPDPAKLRRELDRIAPLLESVLPAIGSPSPDKVKAAIASGLVKKEEFSGAFTRTTRRMVSVAKARPDDRRAE